MAETMRCDLQDKTFELTKMSAMNQLKVLKRLLPLFPTDSKDQDVDVLQSVLGKLPTVSDQDLESLTTIVLEHCGEVINGSTFVIGYRGQIKRDYDLIIVLGLIKESIQFNFNDFFGSVQRLLAQSTPSISQD